MVNKSKPSVVAEFKDAAKLPDRMDPHERFMWLCEKAKGIYSVDELSKPEGIPTRKEAAEEIIRNAGEHFKTHPEETLDGLSIAIVCLSEFRDNKPFMSAVRKFNIFIDRHAIEHHSDAFRRVCDTYLLLDFLSGHASGLRGKIFGMIGSCRRKDTDIPFKSLWKVFRENTLDHLLAYIMAENMLDLAPGRFRQDPDNQESTIYIVDKIADRLDPTYNPNVWLIKWATDLYGDLKRKMLRQQPGLTAKGFELGGGQ